MAENKFKEFVLAMTNFISVINPQSKLPFRSKDLNLFEKYLDMGFQQAVDEVSGTLELSNELAHKVDQLTSIHYRTIIKAWMVKYELGQPSNLPRGMYDL